MLDYFIRDNHLNVQSPPIKNKTTYMLDYFIRDTLINYESPLIKNKEHISLQNKKKSKKQENKT